MINKTLPEMHEEILNFLLIERKKNPDLKFTLRTTNRYGRLEKGYWFVGAKSIVISFWKGQDWKNKTPSIFIEIWQNGLTSLILSAKDEEYISKKKTLKTNLFGKIIDEIIDLKQIKKKKGGEYLVWIKSYSGYNFINNLEDFLNNDKKIIDDCIIRNTTEGIRQITNDEFSSYFKRIKLYREDRQKTQKKIVIKKLQITNIKCFKELSINFENKQNIILAENGKGKSTILQLLAFGLKSIEYPPNQWNDVIRKGENQSEFQITIERNKNEEIYSFKIDDNNKIILPAEIKKIKEEILLFAYGAGRSAKIEQSNIDIIKKTADVSTLVGINQLYNDFDNYIKNKNDFNLIKNIINEIFKYNSHDDYLNIKLKEYKNKNFYFSSPTVRNNSNLSLQTMSDGFRTTFSWIIDFLIRFYFNKKIYITKPDEIHAIVLVDEIDLHLHPKWQRTIVPALSKVFPNVQFIVTTHSPYIAQSVGINNIIKLILDNKQNKIILDEEINEITSELSIESFAKEIYDIESPFSKSVQDDLSKLEKKQLTIIKNNKIENKEEFVNLCNKIASKGEELSAIIQRTIINIHYQTDIKIEL